jgi:hypothetical protein
MIVTIKCSQEETKAATNSDRSELVETMKHRVQGVLSCADQKTQGLLTQMTERINETQVDLQAIRTYFDIRENSLFETITDTREHLHEELGLMIQDEAQMTNTTVDTKRPIWQESRSGPKTEEEEESALTRRSHRSSRGYILGRVPAPARDGNRAQLLNVIRILHHRIAGLGHGRATLIPQGVTSE